MLNLLHETNPSKVWMESKFAFDMVMANGRKIVWKFDLPTAAQGITTDVIRENCEGFILACPSYNFGEFLSVASTIADVVNQRMKRVGEDVTDHVLMASTILAYLDVNETAMAYELTIELTQMLLGYDPEASRVWSAWIQNVLEYADPSSFLGSFLNP